MVSNLDEQQKVNAARELLRGDLISEVISDVKENISQAWSVSDDPEERNRLWYLQKSIDMFGEVLEGYVSNYEFTQKVK